MKGLKVLLATSFLCAAATSNAASYDIFGGLKSYTAVIPSVGTRIGSLDAAFPAILPQVETVGYLIPFPILEVTDLEAQSSVVRGSFQIDYYNIALGGGVVKTVPRSIVTFAGNSIYDASTRHLTASVEGTAFSKDAFCTGAAAVCGSLYREANKVSSSNGWNSAVFSTGTLDLYFTHDLGGFTGTLTEVDTLASGAVITKVYSLSAIPVPFAGLLYGSSLAALGVVGRRRLAA